MRARIILFVFISGIFLAACEKLSISEKDVDTFIANNTTAISAELEGNVAIRTSSPVDYSVVFQCSKSEDFSPAYAIIVKEVVPDGEGNCLATVSGLDPGTTYYFRLSVHWNNQEIHGETKSFRTLGIQTLLDTRKATGLEETEARLNAYLSLSHIPYDKLDYGFFWGASDAVPDKQISCGEIKEDVISAPLTNLTKQTVYSYRAYVTIDGRTFLGEIKTFPTAPEGAVDLGFTGYFNESGEQYLFWSTRNLCEAGFVDSPEMEGDYYAWGEAEDAAGQILGGSWRIPTSMDWRGLFECTLQWDTEKGMNGLRITGPNGKSIFLPAAGYRYQTSLNGKGSTGGYWSSSLSSHTDSAIGFSFSSGGAQSTEFFRYYGLQIRPVWSY